MNVINFLQSIKFSITSGSQFMWNCYGDNAWYIDSTDMEHGTTSAVIDRHTGHLYEVSYCSEEDGDHAMCYKWIDPSYIAAYVSESKSRHVDPWQAYDDVQYNKVDHLESMLSLIRIKQDYNIKKFKHEVRVSEPANSNLSRTYHALDWLRSHSYFDEVHFLFDMHSGTKGYTTFYFVEHEIATQFSLVVG